MGNLAARASVLKMYPYYRYFLSTLGGWPVMAGLVACCREPGRSGNVQPAKAASQRASANEYYQAHAVCVLGCLRAPHHQQHGPCGWLHPLELMGCKDQCQYVTYRTQNVINSLRGHSVSAPIDGQGLAEWWHKYGSVR